jgi:hypothetical protein
LIESIRKGRKKGQFELLVTSWVGQQSWERLKAKIERLKAEDWIKAKGGRWKVEDWIKAKGERRKVEGGRCKEGADLFQKT